MHNPRSGSVCRHSQIHLSSSPGTFCLEFEGCTNRVLDDMFDRLSSSKCQRFNVKKLVQIVRLILVSPYKHAKDDRDIRPT